MNEYLRIFWGKYSQIHNATKELYLLSEEYDAEFASFIQPIKEQRDALEHIVRAYTRFYEKNPNFSESDEKYIKGNLDKALGHEFRSFFDSADLLSIIIRKKLNFELNEFSYSQIINVWEDYETYRKILVNAPREFANMRGAKDIGKSDRDIVEIVKKYCQIITQLFEIHDIYMNDIYPLLHKE